MSTSGSAVLRHQSGGVLVTWSVSVYAGSTVLIMHCFSVTPLVMVDTVLISLTRYLAVYYWSEATACVYVASYNWAS